MDMSPQAIEERCKFAPEAERANCIANNNREKNREHHDGNKDGHHDGNKEGHHDGPPMGNQGMPPMGDTSGMPPMGDPCMNIPNGPDKDACYAGMKGEHHDGPSGMTGGPGGMPNDGPGMAPPLDCPPGSGNPLCAGPQGSAPNPGMTGGPGGPNDHHDGKGPNDHHDGKGPNDHMRGGPNDHRGPGGPNDHHDAPPIDPRSGQPFTQADEVKFQRFADECEATRGLLSEGSTQELVKEGFTRVQVEKLCKDGPEQGSGGGHGGQGGHNAPPARR